MIPETTAPALKSRLDTTSEADPAPFLLDVREPHEFEYCRIDGSVLIPLGQLVRRIDELPRDRPIITICHHGHRSFRAAAFLRQNVGLDAINLFGGVAAWAREVDPTMKQY